MLAYLDDHIGYEMNKTGKAILFEHSDFLNLSIIIKAKNTSFVIKGDLEDQNSAGE